MNKQFVISSLLIGVLSICSCTSQSRIDCDATKCPGPMSFYNEINCKPVYENRRSCCPTRYNCDHLKSKTNDKCIINGTEYRIGERLRNEHKNPCDGHCVCQRFGPTVGFKCYHHRCDTALSRGCWARVKPDSCCEGEVICPSPNRQRFSCNVDGKIYLDGEHFYPRNEPNKICSCLPGYQGKNVAPFCMQLKHPKCGSELNHRAELNFGCVPVYNDNIDLAAGCSKKYICPSEEEKIKASPSARSEYQGYQAVHSSAGMCKFGDWKIPVEWRFTLRRPRLYVKCTCEVPPFLTCILMR